MLLAIPVERLPQRWRLTAPSGVRHNTVDELLALLGWVLVELVLIGTGRAVVAFATFGRWRGEQIASREGRVHGMAGSLSFMRDGQRVVTRTGLLFVGIAVYVLLALAACALWGRA